MSKRFSAVSYASWTKHLTAEDKIYSNVIQETQADLAVIEVAEKIFKNNLDTKPTIMEASTPGDPAEMTISLITKVG